MALSHSPRIVTDGLVLCLDAANKRSYPGSGTTWTDLSTTGASGVLTNGPTFDAANGGSVVFDGTNDHVNIGTPSPMLFTDTESYSYSWWLYKNSPFKDYDEVFSMGLTANQRIHFLIDNAGVLFRWSAFSSSTLITLNTWICVTYTYSSVSANNGTEKFYFNGLQVNSRTGAMPAPTSSGDRWIGAHSHLGMSWPFNGKISSFLAYNKCLSTSEIRQNYLATKGRF